MDEKDGFLFLPSATGEGVLIKRSQIVGGRPNGPDAGSILYTQAGPSIYTTLRPTEVARLCDAEVIAQN
ncbi:hypothetical protein AAG604_03755 [Citromicrobium bathyomarinum]